MSAINPLRWVSVSHPTVDIVEIMLVHDVERKPAIERELGVLKEYTKWVDVNHQT